MSTWMMVASVWAMFAVCIVLFVRGASPRVHGSDEARDERGSERASVSRAKV
ncbi:hypothetical protein AWB79_00618 [Caballeronia hypogeia]|uniref:Uncharacterized protein n=1 Tax=Caballeronia hypogeia TaxID=1777140 RepID=A0A157ZB53_9BURK|nr:hypothetical protein [Caballeronia hypogeia]SAK42703.1 hypothetical protein AWB79_00618 [Caballeronia hypogeia]